MTCLRCTDIHDAQKSGKTQESCKCSCHDWKEMGRTSLGTTSTPFIWTNTTSGDTCTINCATTQLDSIFNYTPKCSCSTQPCEKHHCGYHCKVDCPDCTSED